MWIFSTTGFYTVVAHNKLPDTLIVRARVKKDLTELRRVYMPELSKPTFHLDYDYPYRAMISHAEFGKGMAKLVMDIDYAKFKSAVAQKQGFRRSSIYTRVWNIMIDVENDKNRIKHYFTRGLAMVTEHTGVHPRIKPRQALYTNDRSGGIVRLSDIKEEQGLDGDDDTPRFDWDAHT
jgi:hypothetical protein